jgi:polyferredoxin
MGCFRHAVFRRQSIAVSFVLKNFIAGFVLLILITVASLLVERFFCRYLCPMGAIFAVVSKLRVLRIKKPSAQCGRCRVCTNACPMGIPLYKAEDVKSGECINCMKCVGVCLRGNAAPAAKKEQIAPARYCIDSCCRCCRHIIMQVFS